MRIELHIFGSRTGYGTLAATSGLSPQDCRTLEGGAYRFGQPDSPDYLASLGHSPAFFTRLLPGGRRGLTRVLAGAPDDTGRPTLRMVTAVLTQLDWDRTLGGDIGLLLADAELWHAQPAGPAVDRRYGSPVTQLPTAATLFALAVLTQLEQSRERPITLSEADATLDGVRALEMLIPAPVRPRFTTAWRSLSRKLDVTVNTIADGPAAAGLAGAVNRALAPSPYVRRLTDEGVAAGHVATVLPRVYADFGRTAAAPGPASFDSRYVPPPPPVATKRGRSGRRWVIVSVVLLLALLLAAGGIAWAVHAKRAAAARKAEQIRQAEEADRRATTQRAFEAEQARQQAIAELTTRLSDAIHTSTTAGIDTYVAHQAEVEKQRLAAIARQEEKHRRRLAKERESRQALDIDAQLATTQAADDASITAPATRPTTKPTTKPGHQW